MKGIFDPKLMWDGDAMGLGFAGYNASAWLGVLVVVPWQMGHCPQVLWEGWYE